MSDRRNKLLDRIRQKCVDCSGYSYKEIEECEFKNCPLYPFRAGKWKGIKGVTQTALLRAIRKKCLECCLDSSEEVRKCPVRDCPLYEFRFGKFPQ